MFSFDVGSSYMKISYLPNSLYPFYPHRIGYDLSDSTKTAITNISSIQSAVFNNKSFKLTLEQNSTRYYNIGTLNLPQGGNQAVISVNMCYG